MSKTVALGPLVFLAVALAMPALKGGGYSAARDSISEGALGAYGWMQTAAFVVLGLTSALLVLLTRRELEGRRATAAAVLFGVWAVAVLLCGVFAVDEGAKGATSAAKVHLLAAGIAFVAVLAGMWLSTFAMRSDATWTDRFPVSLAVVALATALFLLTAMAPQDSSWGGGAQRAFTFVVLLWIAGFSLAAG